MKLLNPGDTDLLGRMLDDVTAVTVPDTELLRVLPEDDAVPLMEGRPVVPKSRLPEFALDEPSDTEMATAPPEGLDLDYLSETESSVDASSSDRREVMSTTESLGDGAILPWISPACW